MLAALSAMHLLVSRHPPRTTFKISRLVPLLEDRFQVLVKNACIEAQLRSFLVLNVWVILVDLHDRYFKRLLNLIPSMIFQRA
jgi:hypothetical protein